LSFDLRVVEVSGTPHEAGRAHGEQLRPAIERGLRAWFDRIERSTGVRGQAYATNFLAATNFIPIIENFTPTLLEEVRGIAEGAGQSFEVMLAYQLIDEEWWYRSSVTRSKRTGVEACSAVGVLKGDGTAIVAQNMDLPSYYDGTQVVLKIKTERDLEKLVFTPAGIIATTGVNERGVAVCVNTLAQLRHRPNGLPVAFVVRGILAQEVVEDAVSFLRAVPHASGQNYLVGSARSIRDFECSAGQVREVPLADRQVRHTNHPLVNDDIDPEVEAEVERVSTTRGRLGRLDRDLAGLGEGVSAADVQRTLSDREVPVCVPRGPEWMTLGSVVMELGEEAVVHVAPGPPAETAYTTLRF